jgi:hypothetical protein
MNSSKTYPCPDPAVLAQKVIAAGGPPIDPTKGEGQASADGVTIGWTVMSNQTITITVLAKPWYIPIGTIWAHVDQLFL